MSVNLAGASASAVPWNGDVPLVMSIPAVAAGRRMIMILTHRPAYQWVSVVDDTGARWPSVPAGAGGTGFGPGSGSVSAWAWSKVATGAETTATLNLGKQADYDPATFTAIAYCTTWAPGSGSDLEFTAARGNAPSTGTNPVQFLGYPQIAPDPGDAVIWATGLNSDGGFLSATPTVPGITFGVVSTLTDTAAGIGYGGRLRVDWAQATGGSVSGLLPRVTATLAEADRHGAVVFLRVHESPPVLPQQMPQRFSVLVDWNGDGDYSDPVEDVTAYVRPVRSAVSARYGREPGGDASTTAGSAGFVLDNRTRRFSARNTASPLHGLVLPGRPVSISRTIAGVEYSLFRGHSDSSPLHPDIESRSVSLSLVDYLADFRGPTISTALHAGIRTGDAIGLVLDYAHWPGGRDLDPGATVIPWWWEDGTDGLTALDKIVRSEGYPALLTVGTDGQVIFRDRHHRYLRSASATSQGTWGVSGSEPIMSAGSGPVDDAWGHVVNHASATVDVRQPHLPQVIWQADTAIVMARDETRTVAFSSTDPFLGARVDNGGWSDPRFGYSFDLSRTSGVSAILTIRSGSASSPDFRLTLDATNLRIVANPVAVTSSVRVSATDVASGLAYGVRSFAGDLPWCGPDDAQSLLSRVVAERAVPLAIMSARFVVGKDATRAPLLLARDLSDRVTVVEPESGLAAGFHVEHITHTFTGEADHEMVFELEQAPDHLPAPNLFVLGTSLLGTGTLGW